MTGATDRWGFVASTPALPPAGREVITTDEVETASMDATWEAARTVIEHARRAEFVASINAKPGSV